MNPDHIHFQSLPEALRRSVLQQVQNLPKFVLSLGKSIRTAKCLWSESGPQVRDGSQSGNHMYIFVSSCSNRICITQVHSIMACLLPPESKLQGKQLTVVCFVRDQKQQRY